MTNKAAKEYIDSIISAYKASETVHKLSKDYRKVWLSAQDIEALNLAIEALEDKDVKEDN